MAKDSEKKDIFYQMMDGNYCKRRFIVAQNMMTSEHKSTNEIYRINYDITFRKRKKGNYNVDTKQRKSEKK